MSTSKTRTASALSRFVAAGLVCGVASIIAACAVTAAPVWGDESAQESPYGAYLAALWADRVRSPEDAARYYREALQQDPENAMLVGQAAHAALLAGDWNQARSLAVDALQAEPENTEARLALAADAMARADWRRAVRLLDGAEYDPLDTVAAAILLGWARAGQRNEDAALAALSQPNESPLFGPLVGLHQAMVLDLRDDAQAEAALRTAMDVYALPAFATREYGRFLERHGRGDAARAAYQARLAANPGDTVTAVELARLDAGRSAPRTTPNEAAALGLYGAAAALMGRDVSDRSETYLVLAVRLDEDFGAARLLLGQIMMGQNRFDRAEEMFAQVVDDPAMGVEARIRLAQLESARGDDAAAEALLRALWREDGGEVAARALADALRATAQWAQSEQLLDQLIAERAASGRSEDWELFYGRAIAHERQGEWAEAEADFRAALALNPDDAGLLNYLGYAMVDRGVNLEEGFDLIRRAVSMNPRSGAIVDSLGWAYYRLGDYAEAVENLERAVSLEPGAADINDHLGDAYWRVGRRLEARFQWERALIFEPDDTLRAAVRDKLANGLPPAPEPPALAENQ